MMNVEPASGALESQPNRRGADDLAESVEIAAPAVPAAENVSAAEPAREEETIGITAGRVLATLQRGKVSERGLLPYSSNHSFLVVVTDSGKSSDTSSSRGNTGNGGSLALPAVYKPQRGESPLWDFEWGTLCKRERAAFLISDTLGWDLVPPTVLRTASRGLGSIQFYVDHEEEAHYFTVQQDARFADAFRKLALFDYIANNADRKSGHCLVGRDGRLWAIDHGLTFHTDYKLRSVIWEFAGEPIATTLRTDLSLLLADLTRATDPTTTEIRTVTSVSHEFPSPREGDEYHLPADDAIADTNESDDATPNQIADELCDLLAPDEQRALIGRVRRLLRTGEYPAPDPHRRNYPWPPV